MATISSRKQVVSGTSKAAVIIAVLIGLALFPDRLAAQGLPVETASPVPLAIWVIGTVFLGLALVYGIMRNRGRTRSSKELTEQGTKRVYAEEERDRLRSGAD
jgi:hypothetical protein